MSEKKHTKLRHETKTFQTPLPNIRAKIHVQYYTDHSATLSGYLIDAKTTLRHDSDICGSTTVHHLEQIPSKEKHLVSRLVTKYKQKNTSKPTMVFTDKPYTSAYATLSAEDRQKLCPTTWRAQSTQDSALSYFSTTMLPLLDSYGMDIDITDCLDILSHMQSDAESHGNHLGNPELTQKTVFKHAREFNSLYRSMQALFPECNFPDMELPIPSAARALQTEQCKALPDEVRVKVAVSLEHLISNGLSTGAAIMLSGMARTAEACAPRFNEMLITESYVVYGILTQATNTVRIADLKTDSSYRPIILPRYTRDLLMLRIDWLKKQGFSEEEISLLPVVASRDDPRVMATPKDLSSFFRELLSVLGCDHNYWHAVDTAMLMEPDYIGTTRIPNRDPSAYIARRAGCTMYRNIAGIDVDLLDALMGHRLSKHAVDWASWLRRPENWPVVAAQMERVIFDPHHSAHPLFSPIELHAGDCYHSDFSQIGFAFQADPDGPELEIELCVTSSEAGDAILLLSPSIVLSADSKFVYPSDRSLYPPIVGTVHDLDTYMQWIHEAEDLNLTKFLPKVD